MSLFTTLCLSYRLIYNLTSYKYRTSDKLSLSQIRYNQVYTVSAFLITKFHDRGPRQSLSVLPIKTLGLAHAILPPRKLTHSNHQKKFRTASVTNMTRVAVDNKPAASALPPEAIPPGDCVLSKHR